MADDTPTTATAGLLRVGDTVMWSGGFGLHAAREAKVIGIDLLPRGNPDDGEPVDSVPWSEVRNRCVAVDLDNGHWAYGYQLARVPS